MNDMTSGALTMAECNQCGACCDPVVSVVSPQQLADRRADQVIGTVEADWMRAHLTPIVPRKEGLRMVSDWMNGVSDFVIGGELVLALSWFYRCDLYEPETGRCTDWDNRPDMCRGYPWYGNAPDNRKTLPPACSYRADIGMPVEDRAVNLYRRGRAVL